MLIIGLGEKECGGGENVKSACKGGGETQMGARRAGRLACLISPRFTQRHPKTWRICSRDPAVAGSQL